MIVNKDQLLKDLLAVEWQMTVNSLRSLLLSAEKCRAIGDKQEYTFEEEESFDSLTSKFSRTSDIFTQKIIRTAWTLLHEPFAPFIDRMNNAEKIGLLFSADQMIVIRDMRNQIAHEYLPEALRELVHEVMDLTPQLAKNIDCCHNFLLKRDWISI